MQFLSKVGLHPCCFTLGSFRESSRDQYLYSGIMPVMFEGVEYLKVLTLHLPERGMKIMLDGQINSFKD